VLATLITSVKGQTSIQDLQNSQELYEALKIKQVDIIIENTDTAMQLLNRPVETNLNEAFETVKLAYEKEKRLIWLKPFGFLNGNGGRVQSNTAPVIKAEVLNNFPGLPRVLGKLAGAINDEAYRASTIEVGDKPKKAARDFLKSKAHIARLSLHGFRKQVREDIRLSRSKSWRSAFVFVCAASLPGTFADAQSRHPRLSCCSGFRTEPDRLHGRRIKTLRGHPALHAGVLLLLTGGVVSAWVVATVNVYEGASVDTIPVGHKAGRAPRHGFDGGKDQHGILPRAGESRVRRAGEGGPFMLNRRAFLGDYERPAGSTFRHGI
jgi:hypothetical protein